jgi:hypothetical protein
VRHLAVDRRGLLAVGGVLLAVVVAAAIAWGGNDHERTPGDRARLVLREAAERQRRGCDERLGFTVYTLGERFRREYATRLGARCETRANEAEVFYGPCRDGGESGCGNDISARSRPACQRPSELYTIFNGSSAGDLRNPKTITTLRGVPAAVFEEQIELVTRDTAIIVFADANIAREAVDALRPAARATATGAPLPKPAAAVVAGKLSDLRCPE